MKLTRLLVSLAALCAGGFALRAADTAPAAAAKSDGPPYGYHVNVKLHMNDQGRPETIQIVSSDDTTTSQILNKLALTIAAHSSLPPHLKNGVPEKFTVVQPFFFPIEDDEGPESNNVPMPKVKTAIMPAYPEKMASAEQVGGAIFDVQLDATGQITSLKTLRASAPEAEQAARESVQKWVFTPAQDKGRPVPSHFRVAIGFEGFGKIAEPKWSVAPRPALGSLIVIKNRPEDLVPNPALQEPAADGSGAPAAPADAAPAPATPAK